MHIRFTKIQSLFLLASLLLAGCKPAGAPDQGAEETATAVFTANPQPVPEQPVETLPIGSPAPDFNLPATDGKFYTLGDFADAQVLVIVFTCNHCPTAQAYEDRMKAIAAEYKSKGVDMVAISPNSPLGLLYEELGYTDLGDDFEDMKLRAEHKQYNFPYLYDGDNESVSLQYGPVATPHAYVFDKDRKLRYTGRIDKVEKPGGANGEDLRNAIDAVLAGKEIAEPATKTFGCSTKWAWKTEYKVKMEKEWEEKPVDVAKLDIKGIQDLMKNEGSDKLRLVNVWATWCGPCILEYPEFIVLQRMYGARSFEFVSLSADKPQEEDKVLAFLRGKYSAVPNYLYSEEDKYALIDAVDKNWDGALPYTALIEPGGKIVWSHQGSVDFMELKRAIVEHPMMGRYY